LTKYIINDDDDDDDDVAVVVVVVVGVDDAVPAAVATAATPIAIAAATKGKVVLLLLLLLVFLQLLADPFSPLAPVSKNLDDNDATYRVLLVEKCKHKSCRIVRLLVVEFVMMDLLVLVALDIDGGDTAADILGLHLPAGTMAIRLKAACIMVGKLKHEGMRSGVGAVELLL
jgi:hypothetical protein